MKEEKEEEEEQVIITYTIMSGNSHIHHTSTSSFVIYNSKE